MSTKKKDRWTSTFCVRKFSPDADGQVYRDTSGRWHWALIIRIDCGGRSGVANSEKAAKLACRRMFEAIRK